MSSDFFDLSEHEKNMTLNALHDYGLTIETIESLDRAWYHKQRDRLDKIGLVIEVIEKQK